MFQSVRSRHFYFHKKKLRGKRQTQTDREMECEKRISKPTDRNIDLSRMQELWGVLPETEGKMSPPREVSFHEGEGSWSS